MGLKIGLTGGIGSGKSTVAGLFAALGARVIDADFIAREVVAAGTPGLAAVTEAFGASVVGANGELDRGALRRLVFASPQRRRELEGILHPLIRARMLELAAEGTAGYSLLVIPLLIESGWQDLVDRIAVVDVSERTQLQRTCARDDISVSEAHAILAAQASRQDRLAAADDVIDNEGSESALQTQVRRLHEQYLRLSGQD